MKIQTEVSDNRRRHGIGITDSNRIRLNPYVNLFPFAVGLVLVAYLFASVNRPFWYDEILTYYPATDPSFAHMIASCREPMNTAPPLYFIVLWGYVHLVGDTLLALRSLSTLSFAGVVFLLWRLLRPRYGALVSASAIIATTFVPPVLAQVREARFYGLYCFFSTLMLYVYFSRDTERLSPVLRAIFLFLSATAATFTHTFGLFYSGSLLLAQVVQNIRVFMRRREPRELITGWENAIAIVLSWAIFFAIWGHTSSVQQAAFGGKTWINLPTLVPFFKIAFSSSAFFFIALISLYVAGLLKHKRTRWTDNFANPNVTTDTPLLLFGLFFIFVPLIIGYIYSILFTPCFIGRYFMPLWQGLSLVIAYCLYISVNWQYIEDGNRQRTLFAYFSAVCLIGTLSLWYQLKKFPLSNKPLSTVANTIAINNSLMRSGVPLSTPIIISYPMLFPECYFYQTVPKYQYLFIADDEFANAAHELGGRVTSNVNLKALGRTYLRDHIVTPSSEVIKSLQFVVAEDPHAGDSWVMYMLRKNPGLRAEIIGETKIVIAQFPELPESNLIFYRFTEAKSDTLKAKGDLPGNP